MKKTNRFLLGLGCLYLICVVFALWDHEGSQLGSSETRSLIFWQIRLPRVFMASLVGSSLALCGVLVQTLLKNPLAEPFTLGLSGATALGVSLSTLLSLTPWSGYVFGLSFSLITLLFLLRLNHRYQGDSLILGGIMLNFFFSSAVMLLFSMASPEQLKHILLWLMGDINLIPWHGVVFLTPIVLATTIISLLYHRHLNLIAVSWDYAQQLGVPIAKARLLILLAVGLITTLSVIYCGVIGFVGLIVPHILKIIFGPQHRFLIVGSLWLGASFVLACDTLSRTIAAPQNIPLGVITGFLGGLIVLIMLTKNKSRGLS